MKPAHLVTIAVLACCLLLVGYLYAAPDEHVGVAQICLGLLGFDPGPIDGLAGPKTLRSMDRYLRSRFGPGYPSVPDATVQAIFAAECRVAAKQAEAADRARRAVPSLGPQHSF